MTSKSFGRLGQTPEEGIKAPVKVATTANITLSGLQTIDTYDVQSGDRVLVKDQTVPTENGVYIASSGAWQRSTDWNASNDLADGVLITDANQNILYSVRFTGTYDPDTSTVTFTNILSEAPIAENQIGATELDLTDTYNFTGVINVTNPAFGLQLGTDTALTIFDGGVGGTQAWIPAVSHDNEGNPTFGSTASLTNIATTTSLTITTQAGSFTAYHTGNLIDAVVPVVDKTGGFTFVFSERNSMVVVDSTPNVTATVPNNASVAYSIGTALSILQKGTGQVTIAGEAGVTFVTEVGLITTAQGAFATLLKIGTDEWAVSGSLSA